ncbi:MAG: energy transducer TonB [Opitutaceae bacterium]
MPYIDKSHRPKLGSKAAIGFGLAVALGIFLLVPISQLLDTPERDTLVIESIEMAPPPPPPPPEDPPPPPKPEEEPPPIELKVPPPQLSLEQLELSLNTGTGGDLSFDSSMLFDVATESADELSKLFGFDELDEVPRLVRRGRPREQQSSEFQRLMRRRDTKQVVLEVALDHQGSIDVLNVRSASHEALVPAARQAAESSKFSPPTRNGRSVRARYVWTLNF